MNTLVIYDSQFGNTAHLAQAIARSLSAFGPARAIGVDDHSPGTFAEVDVLVVGCPTQQFRPTPAMRAFLEQLAPTALSHLSIACFDTRIHLPWPLNRTAAPAMVRHLRALGVEPLVPPEGFLVKGKAGPLVAGEVERAAQWVVRLYERYRATHLQVVTP